MRQVPTIVVFGLSGAGLAFAHDALDRAVAAAYGWPEDISTEDALARLLALNPRACEGPGG